MGTVAILVEEAEGLLELRDLVVGELVRHGRWLRRGHATGKGRGWVLVVLASLCGLT